MIRCSTTVLEVFISSTGTDQPVPVNATLAASLLTSGVLAGVRYTRRKSDGLSRLYTTAVDPPSWTKVGEATNNAGFTLFDSTANILVGGHTGGTVGSPTGYFRRAQITNGFDGAGTVIASPNVANALPGATSLVDAQGNTWTVTGASFVTRPRMRYT